MYMQYFIDNERNFFFKVEYDFKFNRSFFIILKYKAPHQSDFCVLQDRRYLTTIWSHSTAPSMITVSTEISQTGQTAQIKTSLTTSGQNDTR